MKLWKRHKDSRVLGVFTRDKPEPHYEVHFERHVEFRTLDGRKLGESKVHQIK